MKGFSSTTRPKEVQVLWIKYTCKHQAQKWSMMLVYDMIYIANLNAYLFFRAQKPELCTGITNAWGCFLRKLSKDLVTLFRKS